MVENHELIRDKNVVAVIDFHEATIYPTDASPGQLPEHIVSADPHGRHHKLHHHAGDPKGVYDEDNTAYWRELTDALATAGAILLFGHGAGKANASHQWVAHVEKHRPDVAAKVVADIRVDIDHLDDRQVLRLAQYYFGAPLLRDSGDSRWGEQGGAKPES